MAVWNTIGFDEGQHYGSNKKDAAPAWEPHLLSRLVFGHRGTWVDPLESLAGADSETRSQPQNQQDPGLSVT